MVARLTDRFQLLVTRRPGVPERLRAMRAAVDWSYELLGEDLRRFLAQISVFTGGWTAQAAAAITLRRDAPECLDRLRTHSLTLLEERRASGPQMRHRLLDTIREYAAERLSAPQRAALRRRHARYYRELAASGRSAPQAQQAAWVDAVEADYANICDALEWHLQARGQQEDCVRFGAAMGRFWVLHGPDAEGREWLARVLALPAAPSEARAEALLSAGALATANGDLDQADAMLRECVGLCREIGNPRCMVRALYELGHAFSGVETQDRARLLMQESLDVARETGDEQAVALSLRGLSLMVIGPDKPERRLEMLTESAALSLAIGDSGTYAATCLHLAFYLDAAGEAAPAERHNEEAATHARIVGDRRTLAHALGRTGWAALQRGDLVAALEQLGEAVALWQGLGVRVPTAWAHLSLVSLALAEQNYPAAVAAVAECLRVHREPWPRVAERAADIAQALGHQQRAARLMGSADAVRIALNKPAEDDLGAAGYAEYRERLTALQRALTSKAFTAAWRDGHSLSWQQTVSLASSLSE